MSLSLWLTLSVSWAPMATCSLMAVTDTQVHLSILLFSHYNSAAIHRYTCFLKNISGGTFLLVQWLGTGLIPG